MCVHLKSVYSAIQEHMNVSVFVCVFTPCLERLVAVSPCLVHWGATICSSSGKRGVWHQVQLMTLVIPSATTASEPQAVHTANQRRAITLSTGWIIFLPSPIILSSVFIQHVCMSLLVQVRIHRIICHLQNLKESVGEVIKWTDVK